jgi:polysaccharide pyruvyl transferase WcaK-like protein
VVEVGVPLAFWAQSVGWFDDDALRRELCACWDSARTVLARDELSAAHVAAAGALRRPAVTADETLLLPERAPAAPTGVVGVALNDRPAAAVPWSGEAAPRAGALERHVELVERLVASGHRVRAVSTVQDLDGGMPGVDNDADHHRAVLERLPASAAAAVEVVDGYVSPARFRELARGLDAIVSQRMHGAMLAMLEGVPAVFASPSFTGSALFAALGLERFVVPEAEPAAVVDAVDAATGIRSSLPVRIARARRAAAANAVLAAQALRLLDDPA